MHRRECSSGDLHARAPQVPGSSEPWALSQGDVLHRGPALSGESCGCHRSAGAGGGDEEGHLWLWLCWGLSFVPRLPPRAASPAGNGVSTDPALSHILPRVGFVQQGCCVAVPQTAAPDTDFPQSRALHSVPSCLATWLAPGAGCAAALGESKPEPQSPGGHLQGWAAPGGQGGRAPREGCRCGQSRGHLSPAEGGAASRSTPPRPFAAPWGPGKLGRMAFPSQVTRSRRASPQGQEGSRNHRLARRAVCG